MFDWLLPLIAAPFVGSWLGVLVRRLPQGKRTAWDRSACESCGQTLAPADLVPIASYLVRRGACRQCGAPIGRFHLAIEVAAAAAAAWAIAADPLDPARIWTSCVLGWILLAAAWIDAQTEWLPDVLTLPLLILGLATTAWLEPGQATDHALAAALGFALFQALAWSYRTLRRREGLGQGDAKLLAAGGAWVGTANLPIALLTGSVMTLGWALLFRRAGLTAVTRLPFGPGLAAGIWLTWLYGA